MTSPLPRCALAACACALLLAACGGGATGSDSTSGNNTPQSAEGWWRGTVVNATATLNLALLVTDAGRYYGLYDTSTGALAGLFTGVQTTSGSALTTSGGIDFGVGLGASSAMAITGTVTTQSSLNGTITEGSTNATLASTYNTAYKTAVTAASLSANYAVSLNTLHNRSLAYTMTRNSGSTTQYTLTPADTTNACRFTVTLTPHTTVGYFDASIATQSTCPTQYTAIGVALPTTATTLLLGTVLPDQSDMLLATATPN